MPYNFLWIDGFDEIGTASQKYIISSEMLDSNMTTSTSNMAYGYGRSLNMYVLGLESWIQKILPGSPFTTLFVGFHWRIDSSDTTERTFLQFWDYANNLIQIEVRRIFDGVSGSFLLRLYRGSTLLATSSAGVFPASFSWVSFKYICHPTSGSFQIAINGNTVLSFNGNTQNGAVSQVHRAMIRTGTVNVNLFCDNLVIATGDPTDPPLPECRVYGLTVPTANFGSVGFTPSAGSNWSNVNEIPPNDDTSYNFSNTVGAQDLFTGNMPSLNGLIYAVKVNSRARKDDAGVRMISSVIRPGSNNYAGSGLEVTPGYFNRGTLWQINPETGLPWTPSDISNLRFGYRVVS